MHWGRLPRTGGPVVFLAPFSSPEIKARLLSDTNPKGGVLINNLELAAQLAQANLFAPNLHPLSHVRTAVDNKASQGWSNRGSVRLATEVGPILRDLFLLTQTHQIYTSVTRIKCANNTMANVTSILNYPPNRMFLRHFGLTFPQKNPWWILTLPSGCRRRLTSMLHSKRCQVDSQPPSYRRTLPPGTNGANSADDWASQPTSKVSGISSISFRSSSSA